MIRIGIDIGSTTAKVAAIDPTGHLIYSGYERHHAQAKETLIALLKKLQEQTGDEHTAVAITGSVGMGFSERYRLPFVQEVVAAVKAIQQKYPSVRSMIDIGGEDAKVVFFDHAEATDLRMNGNCAGGTGAFIDQMAILLGVETSELNRLALNATQVYPIAARCGVFCKTDIQNLIARNASREDIAASIFHAVAVQTVVTLAHGCDIQPPILFCGGPLTFIPALRKAFVQYLSLSESDITLPENAHLFPAFGAALSAAEEKADGTLSELINRLSDEPLTAKKSANGLPPVFNNAEEYAAWRHRIASNKIPRAPFNTGCQDVFIGIDSGSTTTKIVVLNERSELLFSYYSNNKGNPIRTVAEGLTLLVRQCRENGTTLRVLGSCSTGYGEDLIKAAFRLHSGIIETIAHYMAARHTDPDVSFILDIGGQDMKAIFVNKGIINRIEINEACSSGCGSFIETFARTLGHTAQDFSQAACRSAAPCDLGTRCTVFMNSKVKQVLREGATTDDIAAGLACSVVKNCLYKVLKLKDTAELGQHIVVQGGTMRNDAVVRALELHTGTEVSRCDIPELMGAYGCALYALQHPGTALTPDDMLRQADCQTRTLHCSGCDNRCMVMRYRFHDGKNYYSGNRCEKVFTNTETSMRKGTNAYHRKYELLFDRTVTVAQPRLTLGLPRCLNMYEDYPFWHTLLTACDIQVCLSDPSRFTDYEHSARMVMSDNICFPAKLVHSHIQNLCDRGVDRIFMPFVVFERPDKGQNSYNCPIVTGYSEVIKSVQHTDIPIDTPVISFKDKKLLFEQCREYLAGLNIDQPTIIRAFRKALSEQEAYLQAIEEYNTSILWQAERENALTIILAGRPYHTDPLIQHKVSDLLSDMGIHVLTDNLSEAPEVPEGEVHFISQWAYPNRILRAAYWCAQQGPNVQFVQMTSFGCGPDAFLTDEVRDLLMRHHKSLTLLKIDDINNIGSMRLRVKSMVESLKIAQKEAASSATEDFVTTPIFDRKCKRRKILLPFFTPFISPLAPAVMQLAGYDTENLPLSDRSSDEWGLKYANNEVCYPATLIVGDIIKAFKSGKYHPQETSVAITQTGGQCRASNYISLIKKALVNAGYGDVPVVSLTFSESLKNIQPGFRINWLRLLPVALRTILYSDCIARFYYAALVRETEAGQADRLRKLYLDRADRLIRERKSDKLYDLLAQAADDFNRICREADCPKVGIVGEIFLKFNPFAQRHITDWLARRKLEVVPPVLTDFFMQNFVNRRTNVQTHLQRQKAPAFIYDGLYKIVRQQIERVNRTAGRFRYFTPLGDIFHEAEEGRKVISLNAQFGEGWLLPAEIMSYARQGIKNVISLQPFGCIANQIVARGVEKKIKTFYPDLNLLSLDFDSGVSEVNITNRLLLFADKIK